VTELGVVGAGFMGSGIAEVAARAGMQVTLYELDRRALDRSRARIERSVSRAVSRGKLSPTDAARVLARIDGSLQIDTVASGRFGRKLYDYADQTASAAA
jgi:3-hydroxybutyryl-CoA dehydrogenase